MKRFLDFRMNEDPTLEIVDQGRKGDVDWAAYTTTEDGDAVLDLVEIRLANSAQVLQVVEVLAWGDEFDMAFDLAMEHIDVDGKVPFSAVSGWPNGRESVHANVQR